MKRREFITLLGGAALTWPVVATAQQAVMPVIGFLNSGSPADQTSNQPAFHHGLSETSYVEGQNVAIEYRWAEGHNDRLPGLAADLFHRQVAVIVANGPAVFAARAATKTIPIVFFTSGDPVELGLVASLNRPGSNLTGTSSLGVELGPKGLELLRELVPTATVFSLLVNPTYPIVAAQSRDLQAAARYLGLHFHILHASTDRDIDAVFAELARLRGGGLIIATDPFFFSRIEQLAALTARHAVPAIFFNRGFAAAGGLMSYGASIADAYHKIGVYARRILKGANPGELSVQQPTKFELVINLKTAQRLGITIPHTLVARADEVIE